MLDRETAVGVIGRLAARNFVEGLAPSGAPCDRDGLQSDADPFAPIAEKEFIRVYLWYILAESNGDFVARQLRRDLTEEMSAEEIAEAEQRVTAWKPDPASCDSWYLDLLRKARLPE